MSKKNNKTKNAKLKKATKKPELLEVSKPSYLASLLKTFFVPLVVFAIWAVFFSVIHGVDLFSQLALRAKSIEIGKMVKTSESSVIVEFDSVSMQLLGDQSDKRANLFTLVDTLLTSAEPRLIILDYQFSKNEKAGISFKPEYLDKVIWGSAPKDVGQRFYELSFDHNLFEFGNEVERDNVMYTKNWGHMYFSVATESMGVVQSIPLFISPEQYDDTQISPALSLLAYAKGEFQTNGDNLRVLISQEEQTQTKCISAVFSALEECNQLFQPFLFNVPPLPSYFKTFPASFFLEGYHDISLFKNELKDKYIFVTSSWDTSSDYYLTPTADPYSALTKIFNMPGLFGASKSEGKVPGAYLHATILENLLGQHFKPPKRISFGHWQNWLLGLVLAVCTVIIATLLYVIYVRLPWSWSWSVKVQFNENSLYFFAFSFILGLFFITKYLTEFIMLSSNLILTPVPFYAFCVLAGSIILFKCVGDKKSKWSKQ